MQTGLSIHKTLELSCRVVHVLLFEGSLLSFSLGIGVSNCLVKLSLHLSSLSTSAFNSIVVIFFKSDELGISGLALFLTQEVCKLLS